MIPFELWFASLHHFIQVFARTSAMLSVMPGFGQPEISPRNRILVSVGITIIITPIVEYQLAVNQDHLLKFVFLLMQEVIIGFFIGLVARALLAILDFLGSMIGFTTGINSAVLFNPALEDQTHLFSILLTGIGVVLLFVTDFHHLMIKSLVHSYDLLSQGLVVHTQDFAKGLMNAVGAIFKIGFRLSMPFILLSVLLQIAMGLLSRLIPQIHVFFLSMPIQILLGWWVLLILVGGILIGFKNQFMENLASILRIS